ncbi:pantoate--beta-alanine ligase [Clostridiaceae bacterium M8S5]|nr:pantoate--beta-alanine ligase [Clostridiaceae bacterium M8S5]
MKVFSDIVSLREELSSLKNMNYKIGLVPTMGYLHEGHISLIRTSKGENDITVLSIYVNPTQFALDEDLDNYPTDLENDKKVAKEAGADIIFIPCNEIMYSNNHLTYVTVDNLTNNLCGKSRPTHFNGVTTIVTKLFNIVQPDKAYFGQKDAQQAIIIKKMVNDLNIPIKIIECPIVREKDGLAMSSRNAYLNKNERNKATILYKSLQYAKSLIIKGERNAHKITSNIANMITKESGVNIDYINVVDVNTLEDISILKGNILIAIAVKLGDTRLIDNIRLEVQ